MCKADLVTTMVKEFPDLQGVMGREYALLSGEPPEVARRSRSTICPGSPAIGFPPRRRGGGGDGGSADSIVGCFGIGLVPTGSEDPYALRRAALGVVQTLLHHGCRLPLEEAVAAAWRATARPVRPPRRSGRLF